VQQVVVPIASGSLLTKVDKDIEASDAKLLEPSEKSIGRAFEMESRSPHAALTWLSPNGYPAPLAG